MALSDEMDLIETRLKAAGHTVTKLCETAGLARSTWDRWRRGETEPNFKSWRLAKEAAETLLHSSLGDEKAA